MLIFKKDNSKNKDLKILWFRNLNLKKRYIFLIQKQINFVLKEFKILIIRDI